MSDFDGKFNYPDTTPYERRLYALNKELQERIEKAIEYIEWNLEANEEVIEYMNYDGNFKKVLDILKGSDSNG